MADVEREYTLRTGTVTRWEDGKLRRYKAGDVISMTDAEAQRAAHKLAPMQGPATVPIRPTGLSPAQSNSAGTGNPVIPQESLKAQDPEAEKGKPDGPKTQPASAPAKK